jgi:hypothetical protein
VQSGMGRGRELSAGSLISIVRPGRVIFCKHGLEGSVRGRTRLPFFAEEWTTS